MTEHMGRTPPKWIEELRLALGDPALAAFEAPQAASPGPEARQASYRLARALGYCRLFGIEPGELDGTLLGREAMTAVEELEHFLSEWTISARRFTDRWGEAGPLAQYACCAELLEARMDAWAVYLAIFEAHENSVAAREAEVATLTQSIDRMLDALEAFDEVLQQPDHLALLSILTGTQLLQNWRSLLATPYSEVLPWWLDGTLEEAGQRVEAATLATLPSPTAWRRRRESLQSIPLGRRHRADGVLAIQVVAMAADTAAKMTGTKLKWSSPDGKSMARLTCPEWVLPAESIPLEFIQNDYQSAMDLVGVSAWLAGINVIIDGEGIARFDLNRLQAVLRESEKSLILEVGEERIEWQAVEPD
jgi:hypothetical protein